MTTPESLPPLPDEVLISARIQAQTAAGAAGVEIREVFDNAGLEAARRVFDQVWRPGPGDEPVSRGILNALVHAGNYCAAAYPAKRPAVATPVGASVGFLGSVPQPLLHSHVTAVLPGTTSRGVGLALKLHQRWWALRAGLRFITWTYDPLIRRNAYFNAGKLGALPMEYLIDFYGEMNDSINAGQGSDRLLSRWDLLAPHRSPATPVPVTELVVDTADGPAARSDIADILVSVAAANGTVSVPVPPDIEALRQQDPATAGQWRLAVRQTLGRLMNSGWQVLDVTRDGRYLLCPPPSGSVATTE